MSRTYTWKVNNPSKFTVLGCCLAGIAIIVLGIAVGSAIVMGFWNWVLVPTIHVEPIDWYQAIIIAFFINFVGSAFKAISSKD